MDFLKNVYSTEEIGIIIEKLTKAGEAGFINSRFENNSYLMASWQGNELKGISAKWNIKIYKYSNKNKGHSIVVNDRIIFEKLVLEDYRYFDSSAIPVIRIDDAGWGFPLCGVMVGVTNEISVKYSIVPVELFQGINFDSKVFLDYYFSEVLNLLNEFNVTPESHRIEICTGYLNQLLKDKLRNLGYRADVVEIKGMLQDVLETEFGRYICNTVGADIYYDPKCLNANEISKKYYHAIEYGKKYCPELLKTGWKSLY